MAADQLRVEQPLSFWMPVRVAGAALILAGVLAPVPTFARTRGPRHPRATGAHRAARRRRVVPPRRNPMYIAVAATILGQALLLWQMTLLPQAALFCIAVAAFAQLNEEPTPARRFGADYEAYRPAVPRWWPRRHPWTGHGA